MYILLGSSVTLSLFRPWIGALAYYTLGIMAPAALWPWIFGRIRISFYVALGTIIGLAIAVLNKRIDFSILKSKQNVYLFIIAVCAINSYHFSPTIQTVQPTVEVMFDTKYVLEQLLKAIFFYFITILVVDTPKKYHCLIAVILGIGVFYIIWGNLQYTSGRMYHIMSRTGGRGLTGPGFAGIRSVYTDENSFAMFFIVSLPFLFFMGKYYKNFVIKYSLWLLIPLGWHAVFLTGSRGGIVGLVVITFLISIRSKNKLLFIFVPVALILAFTFQAGEYMKDRSETIFETDVDSSIQGRFNAWTVGWKIMLDHPVTGVGPGSFLAAYPTYSDTVPHVAHNTPIQFAAEIGVVAGFMYFLICFQVIKDYFMQLKSSIKYPDPFYSATREAIIVSLSGFFVCALFLNLATYEALYYLLALNTIQKRLTSQKEHGNTDYNSNG